MSSPTEQPLILDTNAVFRYGEAEAHITDGEAPVITATVAAELVAVARRRGMYLPRIATQLPVLPDAADVDLRIRIRDELSQLGVRRGLFGDGSIGATAVLMRAPVVTFDRRLGDVLLGLGLEVRR